MPLPPPQSEHAPQHPPLQARLDDTEAARQAAVSRHEAAEAAAARLSSQVADLQDKLGGRDTALAQERAAVAALQQQAHEQQAAWQEQRVQLLAEHKCEVAALQKVGRGAGELANG